MPALEAALDAVGEARGQGLLEAPALDLDLDLDVTVGTGSAYGHDGGAALDLSLEGATGDGNVESDACASVLTRSAGRARI